VVAIGAQNRHISSAMFKTIVGGAATMDGRLRFAH
jgi:hypothetical protein